MNSAPDKKSFLERLNNWPVFWLILGVCLCYFGVARLSLLLAFEHSNASAVWPPSGLAWAAVLFLGVRVWPGIFWGAFLANALVFLSHQAGSVFFVSLLSLWIAAGNTLEAIVGWYLFRRWMGEANPLNRVRGVFVVLGIALLMCLVSAVNGALGLCLFKMIPWNIYPTVFLTWWTGDLTGILTVLPFFWALRAPSLLSFRTRPKAMVETFLFLALLFTSNLLIFGGDCKISYSHWPVDFITIPFMAWAAFRFRHSGVAVTIFVLAVFSVWGTIHGLGPFGNLPQNDALILVQALLGLTAVTGLLLTATLTERDRYFHQVEKSQKRFESVVEFSSHALLIINEKGTIELVNKMTEQLFGYGRQDLLGQTIDILLPEAYRGQHRLLREQFISSLESRPMIGRELLARHREGTGIPVEIGLNPIHMEEGVYVLVSIIDITERKKAERALKQSEDHFRTMLDNAPVLIWLAGTDGRCTFFNKPWLEFTGRSMEQEIGDGWSEGVYPDDLEQCLKTYSAAFEARQKFTMDYRLKGADGRYRWLMDTGVPLYRFDGTFIGYIGSCADITPLKEAQEILARDKDTLTKLVEERSQQLAQTKTALQQANRLADIGTLAATVAHELRNPLGVIQMAVYNLKQKHLVLAQDKHFANVEKKIAESNQIISNLLTYARLQFPSYEEVNLGDLLEECRQSAVERYKKKAVTVALHRPSFAVMIEADPCQLQQIFDNLLDNAYQSLEEEEGQIDVALKVLETHVEIVIQDTGVGIAPLDLEKVFHPFFTRKAKGTGLGLPICNELVALHHGQIRLESVLNKGTTVRVTLPKRRGHQSISKSDAKD